jgi:hypothetical protein
MLRVTGLYAPEKEAERDADDGMSDAPRGSSFLARNHLWEPQLPDIFRHHESFTSSVRADRKTIMRYQRW